MHAFLKKIPTGLSSLGLLLSILTYNDRHDRCNIMNASLQNGPHHTHTTKALPITSGHQSEIHGLVHFEWIPCPLNWWVWMFSASSKHCTGP